MLLVALGLTAGLFILLRTATYGIGMTNDSVMYISTVRNLLQGNGFVTWNLLLYEDEPPLFPLVLLVISTVGKVEPVEAARYLSAAVFALTVFITTLWLRGRVSSRWLVFWAGCVCALSLSLAQHTATAYTEPLFVLFICSSLFALDRYLEAGDRHLLIIAAICAALTCLTRYVGVALVVGTLSVLLLQRGATRPSRVRETILYSVIAITPVGLWMIRNFLITGQPVGRNYPTDFTLESSLITLAYECVRWVFLETTYLKAGYEKVSAMLAVEYPFVAGIAVIITAFLVSAIGTGCLFKWLRHQGYLQDLSVFVAPASFILAYAAILVVALPLTDIDLPRRYLVPIYIPVLVMVTLVLNELLGCVSNRHLQRKRALPSFVLIACCYLWLIPSSHAAYEDIRYWRENGEGYLSRQWGDSEVIHYLNSHPFNGHIWSTDVRAVYLLTDTWKKGRYLFARLKGDKDRLIARLSPYVGGDEDIYFVWFYYEHRPRPHYTLTELYELLNLEIVAVLEDGMVLKLNKGPGWKRGA